MEQKSFEEGKEGFLKGIQAANTASESGAESPTATEDNISAHVPMSMKLRKKLRAITKKATGFEKKQKHAEYRMEKKREKRKIKNKIARKSRALNFALAK